MANRPVFFISDNKPFYEEKGVEFKFFSGFSPEQKKRSVRSLHSAAKEIFTDAEILEISTKSESPLGVSMSAFNLKYTMKDGKTLPFESVFQSSKVFENGKSYKDLLFSSPIEAKKDPRIRESGRIISFELDGEIFETEPKTLFYDWMYVNAMSKRTELWEDLLRYNGFTDIEFNPNRSINCQARSAAIFVSLLRNSKLEAALESPSSFCRIIYSENEPETEQLSLF